MNIISIESIIRFGSCDVDFFFCNEFFVYLLVNFGGKCLVKLFIVVIVVFDDFFCVEFLVMCMVGYF